MLKVILKKPFRFPTTSLYAEAKVLTVRQLFILRTILRKHPEVPSHCDARKRSNRDIIQTEKHSTTFARNHFYIISSILYNRLNKKLHLSYLNKFELINRVQNWLKTLTYEETEELLT